MKKRKEKRKYVARPGIEPRTPDLRVRCLTDCATRPGMYVCMYVCVRWFWVNFQCRGVLLIWMKVRQGPIALAVVAGWGCLDIFMLLYVFSSLSSSLLETARCRLKYCLKPQTQNNQPTYCSLICMCIYFRAQTVMFSIFAAV